VLTLDGFVLGSTLERFVWTGAPANVSFRVTAPAGGAPGSYLGTAAILHRGLLLTEINFELTLGQPQEAPAPAPPQELDASRLGVRTAFASYSSRDRLRVLERVQGISAVGVNIFLDALNLRAGDRWEQEVLRAIRTRDRFFLFWSPSARDSRHVEQEWRWALTQRGLGFIHPIPLVDPRQAPPPAELSSLHFNDIYLAYATLEAGL
jgi:hypothetical protein